MCVCGVCVCACDMFMSLNQCSLCAYKHLDWWEEGRKEGREG